VFLVSGARLGGEVEEKDPEAEDYSNIKVKTKQTSQYS
jgi:hypothetical protein